MEVKEYIFYITFYDKELLRRAVILLSENNIDFQINDKTSSGSIRAPLSVYFEADIHIISSDFDRASALLQDPDFPK